ncbi:DUF2510 domain-containing protein [Nocardioides dilutus]
MTQTPQTPAGWYPEGGVERWWDGNAWTSHTRPLPGAAPATPPPPYGTAQPYGVVQPAAPAKSNLARNLLIAFAALFLLCGGGCVAVVAFVGNEAENVLNDDTEGGPNNPLTIEPGEGFEVAGFEYADGWTVGPDAAGLLAVQGLKVTNDRGKTDQAFVTISLLSDDEALAEATCTSDGRIPEGRTVTLTCVSSDTMPAEYDEVTIKDVI